MACRGINYSVFIFVLFAGSVRIRIGSVLLVLYYCFCIIGSVLLVLYYQTTSNTNCYVMKLNSKYASIAVLYPQSPRNFT
jgi:hypothetical protein